MRRIIIKSAVLFALALAAASCNEWLDVNPKSQVKEGDLFSDETGFKKQLAGVYSAMVSDKLYGKEMTFGLVDVLAQVWSVSEGTAYDEAKQYNYDEAVTRARINGIWYNMYNAITNDNELLAVIDSRKHVFSGNNYAIIKGEALALRAFLHFDLLRLFGASFVVDPEKPSIPYVVEYGPKVSPQRTVTEAAELVLNDLAAARELLAADPIKTGQTITENDDEGYLINRQFHMNYYAATALMARVHAYMGEFDKAAPYAREVIDSEKFPWVTQSAIATSDINTRDLVFSTEHVFSLNVVNMQTLGDKYFKNTSNTNYFSFSKYEMAYFGIATDYRRYLLVSGTEWFYAKYWQYKEQPAACQKRMAMIRISEMHMILAEAQRTANLASAVSLLQPLIKARNLGTVTITTVANFDTFLLNEYRREFLAEGQLFYYYKRKNTTAIANAPASVITKNGYILPLPDQEVEFGGREANR